LAGDAGNLIAAQEPFLFSAAISAVHLQWPWQDKYFTFTLSRPLRAFFFFAVSVSDFNFPLPARPKLSPLMRCKSVPKTLTAKSNTGRMERGIRIRIRIYMAKQRRRSDRKSEQRMHKVKIKLAFFQTPQGSRATRGSAILGHGIKSKATQFPGERRVSLGRIRVLPANKVFASFCHCLSLAAT